MSFSIKSHLFTTTISPLPASCAIPAIFLSCSVTPSFASIIRIQTSQRSIAAIALITLNFSISSFTLFLRLIPAVSIKVNISPFHLNGVSIESLVVPAISETITLFSPTSLFMIDDFPTFGFPITAILVFSSSSFVPNGKFDTSSSSKSPIPSIFAAEIAKTLPSPNS